VRLVAVGASGSVECAGHTPVGPSELGGNDDQDMSSPTLSNEEQIIPMGERAVMPRHILVRSDSVVWREDELSNVLVVTVIGHSDGAEEHVITTIALQFGRRG